MDKATSGAVTIRPYQASDQPGVEWLYSRTPPWGRTYPRPQPIPDDIRRTAEAFEYVIVATDQDRDGEAVVGLATVSKAAAADDTIALPPFIDLTRKTARLHHVLVAPERWRRGIGRRLVQDAIDWASRHEYQAVVLDTTTEQEGAVTFYHALGFHEAGRTQFKEWRIVWFELTLESGRLVTQPGS